MANSRCALQLVILTSLEPWSPITWELKTGAGSEERYPTPVVLELTGGDRRRSLLVAALGFALITRPESALVRAWLDTWTGLGLIVVGMARQGYDLALTRYDELGWRATFYVSGREHSPTGATGSAFEATPWLAVQRAAWETLQRPA